MENKRKTKIEKGYLVEVLYNFAQGYPRRETYYLPTYNLALSCAKEEKRGALYSGVGRRVLIKQVNADTYETLRTYPEVTL